jgi:predicted peroxiredoxin
MAFAISNPKTISERRQQGGLVMTNNVLITLSCGTDNPNRATRAVFFAMAAHKENKNVTIFLLDDGVFIAKKGMSEHIKAATGDSCDDHISYLQAHEVPILVCTPCAKSRQIEEMDLIEGARMATGGEMIQLACDAAVISL